MAVSYAWQLEPPRLAVESSYCKNTMKTLKKKKDMLDKNWKQKNTWGRVGAIISIGIVIAVIVYGQKNVKEKLGKEIETEQTTEPLVEHMDIQETDEREETEETESSQVESLGYAFHTTEETRPIVEEEIISSNAILVKESTNTIVAERGAFERISPASMTKVLTVLVAAEFISEEQLDDPFTITYEITDYAYVNDCSTAGFLNGETVTVRDLFYGTILPSGADAAVALAIYTTGSHEAFVDKMNEKLEQLGLSETAHVTNCVGLYDENHYCTVYDMAIIMKAAMQNPFAKEVVSTRCYTTSANEQHPEGLVLSNWFIRRIEDRDTGGVVLGAKTGFVMQSKSCAVSYGIFADETPYICVTTGSSSSWRCIDDHVDIYTKYIP